jgi:hypothetical protein
MAGVADHQVLELSKFFMRIAPALVTVNAVRTGCQDNGFSVFEFTQSLVEGNNFCRANKPICLLSPPASNPETADLFHPSYGHRPAKPNPVQELSVQCEHSSKFLYSVSLVCATNFDLVSAFGKRFPVPYLFPLSGAHEANPSINARIP